VDPLGGSYYATAGSAGKEAIAPAVRGIGHRFLTAAVASVMYSAPECEVAEDVSSTALAGSGSG
jgi:hypothetical protein